MLMLKPLPINQSATNASISIITFIVPTSFTTHEFAHVLDSLVRVSRRVEWNNIVTIYNVRKMTHSHKIAHTCTIMQGLANTTPQFLSCSKVDRTRSIRAAGAELPCSKSYAHPRTDGDIQGKKHHMHPDQIPQHYTHWCSRSSP